MNNRLPRLRQATGTGMIYVAQRGSAFKIGFSRASVRRRVADAAGVLVLTIPAGAQPASLERAIHIHFAAKRLPSQGNKPGDKREWYALDQADLDWLKGLVQHASDHKILRPVKSRQTTTDCALERARSV